MSDDEGCYQTLANIADSVRVRMMEQSKGDTPWKPVDEQVIEVFQRYEAEITRLKEQIQEMANKAADKHLSGYRELGAKCAALETDNDRLKEELAGCKEPRMVEWDTVKLNLDIVAEGELDQLLYDAGETQPNDIMARRADRAIRANKEITRLQAELQSYKENLTYWINEAAFQKRKAETCKDNALESQRESAYAYDNGAEAARTGIQELFVSPDGFIPWEEAEGEKPFCRIEFYEDSGDSSVGIPSVSFWALADNQDDTELSDMIRALKGKDTP